MQHLEVGLEGAVLGHPRGEEGEEEQEEQDEQEEQEVNNEGENGIQEQHLGGSRGCSPRPP